MTGGLAATSWFRRLEIALQFDAGLEIMLLVGPGPLARPVLGQLAHALARFGAPVWHRLDHEGLDSLLGATGPGLQLVHGFERMPRERASDLAARLNLNRDVLLGVGAPILMWVPDDFYEELLTQAPDFVAWRSQVSVVGLDDVELDDVELAREAVLVDALTQLERRPDDERLGLRILPELEVELPSGERAPLLEWARTQGAACLDGETANMTLMRWCAWRSARDAEQSEAMSIPVLLSRFDVMLARAAISSSGVEQRVSRGLWQAWTDGDLEMILDIRLTPALHGQWTTWLGHNGSLAWVQGAHVRVAPLQDSQIEHMCTAALAESPTQESVRCKEWLETMMVYIREDMRDWRIARGSIQYLTSFGRREAADRVRRSGHRRDIMNAIRYYFIARDEVDIKEIAPHFDNPENIPGIAQIAFKLARHVDAGFDSQLLDGCVSILRDIEPSPTLVDALLGKYHIEAVDGRDGINHAREAVSVARGLPPEHYAHLVAALRTLALGLPLTNQCEESLHLINEAISLSTTHVQTTGAITQLITLIQTKAEILDDADRLDEAIAANAEALGLVRAKHADSSLLIGVLKQHVSLLVRAERSKEALPLQRLLHQIRLANLPRGEQLGNLVMEHARFLYRAGEHEEAIATQTKAIDLMRSVESPHDLAVGLGTLSVWLMTSHQEKAIALLDECIPLLRSELADDGPYPALQRRLGDALVQRATCLHALARPGAREALEEAIAIYEAVQPRHLDFASLATALEQLGDLTQTSDPSAARAAYARALELSHALPSRGEALPRALEHKLRALADA